LNVRNKTRNDKKRLNGKLKNWREKNSKSWTRNCGKLRRKKSSWKSLSRKGETRQRNGFITNNKESACSVNA
jgi:hypothetical protein